MEKWIKTDNEIFHWLILSCKQMLFLATRVSELTTKTWVEFLSLIIAIAMN